MRKIEAEAEAEEVEEEKPEPKKDQWIRKIRLGTFEDSGKCKGCAVVSLPRKERV